MPDERRRRLGRLVMSHNELPPADASDMEHFNENRTRYPLELLIPYEGRHVAWSLDGTRILADGESEEEVEEKLVASGIQPDRVVFDYIDPPR
jgi:hypothetical protein